MIREIIWRIKKIVRKKNNSPINKGKNGTFIFIHINKTGGTSIAEAIGLPNKRHLHVKEVISIIGEANFNKAFVFTVVRNPWDKVVSHYKYRVKKNITNMADNHISFKEWVKQTYGNEKNPIYYNNSRMFETQCDWLKDSNGIIRVNNILKFESLTKDFQIATKIIGIEKKLLHLNATKKDSYIKYYDKETIEIVRNWFNEDIERFNYDFDKTGSNK